MMRRSLGSAVTRGPSSAQLARLRRPSDDTENESGPVTHDFNLLSAENEHGHGREQKRVPDVRAKGSSRQG
jgi:hypothetical protein